MDRLKDVGEDRPDDEIDLVAFEQALDLGDGAVRLEFVIGDDDLDVAPAHLAAEVLDRERKAVANLLAQRSRRTRQGHDHADLQLLLRGAGCGGNPDTRPRARPISTVLHDLFSL